MRHPFVIDHPARMVKSGIADELTTMVQKGISPYRPAIAAMLNAAGFDRRMNVKRSAPSKKLPTLSASQRAEKTSDIQTESEPHRLLSVFMSGIDSGNPSSRNACRVLRV